MPEVLPLHQKCTKSASVTPEVLPPNRKCFRQTGSAFPEPEVHLNCFHHTGDEPKVLPLNRKGTKSPSANRKCTKSALDKAKMYLKCFCCRGGVAISWEVPLLHERCHHHTGGAFTVRKVPPPHRMCRRCYIGGTAAAT